MLKFVSIGDMPLALLTKYISASTPSMLGVISPVRALLAKDVRAVEVHWHERFDSGNDL